jgi:hypothetical protein
MNRLFPRDRAAAAIELLQGTTINCHREERSDVAIQKDRWFIEDSGLLRGVLCPPGARNDEN